MFSEWMNDLLHDSINYSHEEKNVEQRSEQYKLQVLLIQKWRLDIERWS